MKVGLVLGAGGVTGGAWLTGALHAIVDETGWDPGTADTVVGTSAGSMIGTLVAAGGIPPWFMRAHSAGEVFDGLTDRQGRPAAEADRSAGADFRLHRGLPLPGPGPRAGGPPRRAGPASPRPRARPRPARASRRGGGGARRRPRPPPPGALMAGWLPGGVISTEPLKEIVRRVIPEGWGAHPR